MTTQIRRLTYEGYLELPETKKRYDIVDGVMKMAPAPTLEHQRILRRLSFIVNQFVEENNLGEMFFAPADLLVQSEPLRIRQPDLMVVGEEHGVVEGQTLAVAPNLIAEILSPSNSRNEVERKLADYAGIGVKECWLVSPEARTFEILELDEGKWKRIYLFGLGDTLKSNVLEGFEIELARIF